jgi:hypothetical protein
MKLFALFLMGCALPACGALDAGQTGEEFSRPPIQIGPTPPPIVRIPLGQPELLSGFRHGMGARAYLMEISGSLRQLDFDPAGKRGGEREIVKLNGYSAMTAFDTIAHGRQQVLAADALGNIFFISQDDLGTFQKQQLTHLDNVVGLAAYQPGNDVYYHAYVLQSSGWLSELYFTDVGLAGINANVTYVGPSAGMAGFYNEQDLGIRSHLLILNNTGLWDYHFNPVWGGTGGTFLADYIGRYANATGVAGWVGNDGVSRLAVAGPDGVVHSQSWTSSGFKVGPDLGVVPGAGPLVALDSVLTPSTIYTLTNDSRLHRLVAGVDSVVASYDSTGGNPVSVIAELAGLPEMQIELDVCLTAAQRASLAATATASLANLNNPQAKQYFSKAVFYSDCYANHREKGGLWRIDITKPSRDLAMASQGIIDSGDYAFKLQGWTLQGLTALVWQSTAKQNGSTTLQGYTLNLDSSNHATIDLHVDATLNLLPPFPPAPAGADYTDHLSISPTDTLACSNGHSYGAPDEPSVGCLSAAAFPATATLYTAPQQLHYHRVYVDSTGMLAEGTFY